MKKEYDTRVSSGCIIFNNHTRDEVLVIWNANKDKPALPKGKIESNESAQEAAIREVLEETGYSVEILNATPVTVTGLRQRKEPYLMITTQFFLAKLTNTTPIAKEDKSIISVEWMKVDRALQELAFPEEIEALSNMLLVRGGLL
ncbi:NUDIX domain-containing protein [Paenibacillus sp. NPDC056579]|uniref:NUDIX domain-containing protein n=1 Tax=Paenibacillus sp. NPDC056579 TaxID=3345871 RepID=UPI00369828E3